ncbi:MAG: AsmA-like C-terminal domain-containing protein, partial [Candidatus Binatia bacterium]
DKIGSELASRVAGRFVFGKIALVWLPRPAVVIERAELSLDGRYHASIRTAKFYPSLLYLLAGRWVVRGAVLQGAKLTLRLPDKPEKPFDPAEWEKQIRSALVRLTTEFPAPRIDVSDGSAEIEIRGKPPVRIEDAALQTAGSGEELRFELSARSNLCERLTIGGRISAESLASELQIGVQRLKIEESRPFLPLPISEYAQRGEASLDLKVAAVGLRKVKANIAGSVGPLLLARHAGTATVEAKRLEVEITYEGGTVQVQVDQLDLGAPRLKASGALRIESGSVSGRIDIRQADIGELGDLALRVADDEENVKRILRYVPAGTIPELRVQSAGRTLAEMALIKNVVVSGLVRNCQIPIPGSDLELKNVAGSVRMSDGILEADAVSMNLGTTKGWNGKLRLGLEGGTAPFHLDILLQASAPELHSVLLRLVRDEALRGELLNLRNVEGELYGRLILGETFDAISPVVEISKAAMSATYAPIPFPIAIRRGRFGYDQRLVRLENAHGSIGRSAFSGLSLTLHHDGSRQIKVDSGPISLDLQQTDALLRSFDGLRFHFEKLQSAGGRMELESLTLAGAYDDPAGWTFASAGAFDQVEVTHADLPGRITLSHGKLDADERRTILTGTVVRMFDASLTIGGTFEYKKGGLFQLETSGMGTIGEQMTHWLSRRVELPEELKLRSPLKIAAGRLAWRAGGDISFRGAVVAAGGPQLSLDVVKDPQGLAVKNLTVDDGDRRSRMTLQFAKDHLDLSFAGDLTQETIDKVFTSFPMQGGSLRGDIQARASLEGPLRVSARGQLEGRNLWIPLGTEKALVETFRLEASEENVVIRSADLRWRNSRVAIAGKVAGQKDALRVDLDVSGDRLNWKELDRLISKVDDQPSVKGSRGLSLPPMQGTIRFKADSFTFERFHLSPLQITAIVGPPGIKADIGRAVACGIEIAGSVDVAGDEIGVDLRLAATEAELEPATACLTNRQNDVKGTYSLKARVWGRGDRDRLLRALKGNFDFNAHDGEFIRSPGIDATFDYLNATGDFRVAFPDLDRETFPYRFVRIKGRIEGEILVGDEINIQSSMLNVSGQGEVDLARQQIDAKGLIAVLKPVDEVIGRIPLVGSIFGGSLVGIPVRVSGSLERPEVNYLSPADVGTELLNIPMRILGIPTEAMKLFTPTQSPQLTQ